MDITHRLCVSADNELSRSPHQLTVGGLLKLHPTHGPGLSAAAPTQSDCGQTFITQRRKKDHQPLALALSFEWHCLGVLRAQVQDIKRHVGSPLPVDAVAL